MGAIAKPVRSTFRVQRGCGGFGRGARKVGPNIPHGSVHVFERNQSFFSGGRVTIGVLPITHLIGIGMNVGGVSSQSFEVSVYPVVLGSFSGVFRIAIAIGIGIGVPEVDGVFFVNAPSQSSSSSLRIVGAWVSASLSLQSVLSDTWPEGTSQEVTTV